MHNYICDKKVKMQNDEGKWTTTYIRISEAINANHQYFCIVELPYILKKPREIYGVDYAQAKALAIGFLQDIMQDYRIIDENGQSVKIP